MTAPEPGGGRLRPDAGRLWAGGVATAVVAALIALVGVLICQNAFDVQMVQPPLVPIGSTFPIQYAVTAAVFALAATAVAHLLILSTPRPRAFFSWILGLATTAGVVIPLTLDGTAAGRVATAVVDLVIGLSVLQLVSSVVGRTTRVAPPVRLGSAVPRDPRSR
jgi:hypothetical protein